MLQFFLDNNILHPAQHGFLQGRSTCTSLMERMNDWTLSVQYKRLVTVVYIDFSKAFDVVSQDKLLIRLAAYGITGTLLKWLQSHINNMFSHAKTLLLETTFCLLWYFFDL